MEPYYIFVSVFISFFISTAGIIVIPITSVIQRIVCLTIHSTPITIIIIVVNIIIVIVFIVTSLKIIFKNF